MLDKKQFENLGIYEIRKIAREKGVYSPTKLRREKLIEQIIKVDSGEIKPYQKKSKGRPPKYVSTPKMKVYDCGKCEALQKMLEMIDMVKLPLTQLVELLEFYKENFYEVYNKIFKNEE